jgi:hypothetical protein
MAAVFQPERQASGLSLFSDGAEMLVTFGRDLLRLKYPFVRSVNMSQRGNHYYETMLDPGARRYVMEPPEVTVEIVAGLGATVRNCEIPSLMQFAERLTVEQLFQVIQRKLKARDDERS